MEISKISVDKIIRLAFMFWRNAGAFFQQEKVFARFFYNNHKWPPSNMCAQIDEHVWMWWDYNGTKIMTFLYTANKLEA